MLLFQVLFLNLKGRKAVWDACGGRETEGRVRERGRSKMKVWVVMIKR